MDARREPHRALQHGRAVGHAHVVPREARHGGSPAVPEDDAVGEREPRDQGAREIVLVEETPGFAYWAPGSQWGNSSPIMTATAIGIILTRRATSE